MILHIPASIGEIVDKITILEIKQKMITNVDKLTNVARELALLTLFVKDLSIDSDELAEINWQLWQIEDHLRRKEAVAEFDDEFIMLARSVYKLNDTRAQLKKQINLAHGSGLIEEKSYSTDSQ